MNNRLTIERFVEENFDLTPIPEAIKTALSDRDGLAFYRACDRYNFRPQDEMQEELFAQGYFFAEKSKPLPLSTSSSRKPRINYPIFLKTMQAYERSHSLNMDPFKHAGLKREILEQAGYSHVKGNGKGNRLTLDEASDYRIGQVFNRVYDAALKETQRQ